MAMSPEEIEAWKNDACERGRKSLEEKAAKAAALAAVGPQPDPIEQWETEVEAEAAAHGGTLPPEIPPYFSPNKRLVRLPDVQAPAPSGDTEIILNGLIEDCRMLIREVAFHTARLTPDPDIRLRALTTAQTLAVAGATVGKTVAVLRKRKENKSETRHRMIVEHVQRNDEAKQWES